MSTAGRADSTITLPMTENGTIKITEIALTFDSRSTSVSQSSEDPNSSGNTNGDSDQYAYDKTKANAYLFTFLVVLAVMFIVSVIVWIRFRRRQRLRATLYGSVARSFFISGEWDDESPAIWRGRRRRVFNLPSPTIHESWISMKSESWTPYGGSISDIKPTSIIASHIPNAFSGGLNTQALLPHPNPSTTVRLISTEPDIQRQEDASELPIQAVRAAGKADSDGMGVNGLVVAVLITMPTLLRRDMGREDDISVEDILPEVTVGTAEVGLLD